MIDWLIKVIDNDEGDDCDDDYNEDDWLITVIDDDDDDDNEWWQELVVEVAGDEHGSDDKDNGYYDHGGWMKVMIRNMLTDNDFKWSIDDEGDENFDNDGNSLLPSEFLVQPN